MMDLRRVSTLVVDDLDLMRAVTVSQLKDMGCEEIRVARNGAEALDMLRVKPVDLVLSDWSMPVMSGLDLFKAIRADKRLAHLPFLMITAEAERAKIAQVVAAGVSSLLVKPYTIASLRSRIERVLSDTPRGGLNSPTAALAVQEAAAAAPLVPLRSRGPEESPRILVVDSDQPTLDRISKLFGDRYKVRTAHSLALALAACSKAPLPDLLIMEASTPKLDGFDIAARIRELPEAAQIPVIFLTESNDDATRTRSMALGAVDHVPKSTDPAYLRARVDNFVKFLDRRRSLQADYDGLVQTARKMEEAEQTSRHDIKGSLAGIVGMVKSLAEDESMAPAHASKLRLVEQTATQALELVRLSSDLYKMEHGEFTLQPSPVDLGAVLRSVAEVLRNAFEGKHLVISVESDVPVGTVTPHVSGDPLLCFSLFQNLMKNACEAAPRGSKVEVTLLDQTPVKVEIRNRGAVPREIRDRFFDKFSTSGKTHGTGLGTYSALKLATAQGGTVTMSTSDEDNSTTLTVKLPRHKLAVPA